MQPIKMAGWLAGFAAAIILIAVFAWAPWVLLALSGAVLVGLVVGVRWLAKHKERVRRNHTLVKWRAPKRVYYLWATTLAVASALVVMLQAADRNLPDKTWPWVHSSRVQLNAALSLALLSFAEALRRLYRRSSAGGESELRRSVRNHLGTAIANVSETTHVAPGAFGCGLFMVRHHWFGEPTLERVERVRLLDTVADSGTKYTKGKGTVGMCWELNKRQHHSWLEVNGRWEANPPDEKRWERIKADTKHGFTFSEWTTMLGRYSEVLAIPVTVAGTLVGCIALDRRWDRDATGHTDVLKSATVEEAVGAVARALEPVLAKG